MSVRRQKDDYFNAPQQIVADAVRVVLSRCPQYVSTTETKKDSIFDTNVRPSWWLLGTDMTIELQSSSSGTLLIARTTSQWFIMGDVFNYYNRYLRDLFGNVKAELQRRSV
jgi:hypothetical protein